MWALSPWGLGKAGRSALNVPTEPRLLQLTLTYNSLSAIRILHPEY